VSGFAERVVNADVMELQVTDAKEYGYPAPPITISPTKVSVWLVVTEHVGELTPLVSASDVKVPHVSNVVSPVYAEISNAD
jgi:hypothetical protein